MSPYTLHGLCHAQFSTILTALSLRALPYQLAVCINFVYGCDQQTSATAYSVTMTCGSPVIQTSVLWVMLHLQSCKMPPKTCTYTKLFLVAPTSALSSGMVLVIFPVSYYISGFHNRWRLVEAGIYALSLEYEAGGVGRTLFDGYHLRLDCDPHTVSFMI